MADKLTTAKNAVTNEQAFTRPETTLSISTNTTGSQQVESRPILGKVMSTLGDISELYTSKEGQEYLNSQLIEIMGGEYEAWEVVEKPTLIDRVKNIFYGLVRKAVRSQLTGGEDGVHEERYTELDPDDDYVILGVE